MEVNNEKIDEMIAVMQAYKEGKTIECRMFCYDDWKEADDVQWNWVLYDYRVKPESKYVPYDSVSEIDRSKWVREKEYPSALRAINMINTTPNEVHISGYGWHTLEEFFETYEYEDGTPCGKLVVDEDGTPWGKVVKE